MRPVLVDGFLLYQNPTNRERLDVRLFSRLSHDVAKERRFNRPGYRPEAWILENRGSFRENGLAFIFQDGNAEGDVDVNKIFCQDSQLYQRFYFFIFLSFCTPIFHSENPFPLFSPLSSLAPRGPSQSASRLSATPPLLRHRLHRTIQRTTVPFDFLSLKRTHQLLLNTTPFAALT